LPFVLGKKEKEAGFDDASPLSSTDLQLFGDYSAPISGNAGNLLEFTDNKLIDTFLLAVNHP
jgi:hypothetical protein